MTHTFGLTMADPDNAIAYCACGGWHALWIKGQGAIDIGVLNLQSEWRAHLERVANPLVRVHDSRCDDPAGPCICDSLVYPLPEARHDPWSKEALDDLTPEAKAQRDDWLMGEWLSKAVRDGMVVTVRTEPRTDDLYAKLHPDIKVSADAPTHGKTKIKLAREGIDLDDELDDSVYPHNPFTGF